MDQKSIKPYISVVIPVYGCPDGLEELYERLVKSIEPITTNFELILVNDASPDRSWEIIQKLALDDARVLGVNLSRNFGQHPAIFAGLKHSSGDWVVVMDCDLQDPPELISDFLRKWEEGWENIYGVLTKRVGTGPIRTMNSKLFYWVAGKLTDGRIPKNASDFRLVDRKVYETVRTMSERNRFVRGLFAWVGFRSIGIPMERPPRFGGVSNAHTFKVIDLAFKGIFANSYKPLRLITLFGLGLSLLSFVSIIPLALLWIFSGVPFAGFGTLVSLFLLVLGFLSLMLGILSEYVGLIYEEVKGRPNFIVSNKIGL